jgi:hypothetical protein
MRHASSNNFSDKFLSFYLSLVYIPVFSSAPCSETTLTFFFLVVVQIQYHVTLQKIQTCIVHRDGGYMLEDPGFRDTS